MPLTRPKAHQLSGQSAKSSVRVVTTSNVTLSGGAPASVDGVSLTLEDRILVTAQTDATENGIYRVTTVGSGSNGTWIRGRDANQNEEVLAGMTTMVSEGTTYADTFWKLSTDGDVTLGTTELVFEQHSTVEAKSIANLSDVTLTSTSSNDVLTYNGSAWVNSTSIDLSGNIDGANINVDDTLRIAQSGSGLRMTNVGAFDNDGSDNFRVFATNDLILAANGESGTAITIDATNQDVAVSNDLTVSGELTVDTNTFHVDPTNNRVGIGTTTPTYQVEIENTGNNALLVLDRTDGASTFIEGGASTSVLGSVGANDVKIAYNSVPVVTIGAGGAITTSGNVTAGNFTTAGQMQADLIRNREQRYTTSNMMKFNQLYTGAASGSYFSQNEYQKIVTIIPSGDSQNYQVSGRILCQTAGSIQTINFIAALRSNTLPDLDWSIVYTDDHNGTAHFKPQLWTKETTTAGFIFAIQKISSGDLYGTVTVDLDVIPRASSQLDNVTVNTTQDSEQASVDAGYTANDMTLVRTISGTDVTFGGNVGIGNASPASPLTVAGVIESTTGGVKFPDGTTQTSAASGGVTEATAIEYAIALG